MLVLLSSSAAAIAGDGGWTSFTRDSAGVVVGRLTAERSGERNSVLFTMEVDTVLSGPAVATLSVVHPYDPRVVHLSHELAIPALGKRLLLGYVPLDADDPSAGVRIVTLLSESELDGRSRARLEDGDPVGIVSCDTGPGGVNMEDMYPPGSLIPGVSNADFERIEIERSLTWEVVSNAAAACIRASRGG